MKPHWFVIRLKPGASAPSRQDSRISKIEYSLKRAGVEYYFPVERSEKIHKRTKVLLDKRRPLMPGYAFVFDVQDWYQLHRIDFVAGVLSVAGKPVLIREDLINGVREAEQAIYEVYQHRKGMRIQAEKEKEERANGMSARKAKQLYPAGSPVFVGGSHLLRGMKGRVVEATGRQTIKVMIETLSGLINAEISTVHLEMVA